jgi:hypothetical protein
MNMCIIKFENFNHQLQFQNKLFVFHPIAELFSIFSLQTPFEVENSGTELQNIITLQCSTEM